MFGFLKLRLGSEHFVTKVCSTVRSIARGQEVKHLIDGLAIKSFRKKEGFVLLLTRQPEDVRLQRFDSDGFKQVHLPATSSTYSLTKSRFSIEPSSNRSIGFLPFKVSWDSLSHSFSTASSRKSADNNFLI